MTRFESLLEEARRLRPVDPASASDLLVRGIAALERASVCRTPGSGCFPERNHQARRAETRRPRRADRGGSRRREARRHRRRIGGADSGASVSRKALCPLDARPLPIGASGRSPPGVSAGCASFSQKSSESTRPPISRNSRIRSSARIRRCELAIAPTGTKRSPCYSLTSNRVRLSGRPNRPRWASSSPSTTAVGAAGRPARGRIFKQSGDGALVAFPTVAQAVATAEGHAAKAARSDLLHADGNRQR